MIAPSERGGLSEAVRQAPTGILVVGALLALLGAGLVIGGVYVGISRPDAGWIPWAAVLLVGPIFLYVAFHLLYLTPWSWLAILLLTLLLLGSSAARALQEPGIPLAPLAEIAVELVLLAYLFRRGVRRAFGRA